MDTPTATANSVLGQSPQDMQAELESFTEKFNSATSEHELLELVELIDQKSQQINRDLNNYVVLNQKAHQQDINNIELTRSKLSSTIATAGGLKQLFSDSNDLGSSLTFKLKSLDKEISYVDETIEYVSKMQVLKNNIDQAVYATEHGNWELAAQCIHTIRSQVPQTVIEGKYASVVIPSTEIPELPQVTIEKTTSQLAEIFQAKFNEAAGAKDIPQLTKYFQLFPLIGQEETGLKCYSRFICQIITDTSRSLVQSISGELSAKPGVYSKSSMQLFENISMMLAQHAPLIRKYYASTYKNAIVYVITKIQHEIDSQIGLITDTFYDTNRIGKVLQDVGLYQFPVLSRRANDAGIAETEPTSEFNDDDELVTIVKAGDLANELSNILNCWCLYCKFITTRYFPQSKAEHLQIPPLILESNFTKKILTKFLPAFEAITTFYFRRSLEKAIIIEELPSLDQLLLATAEAAYPEQPPCSSVVEDVTLVLNASLRNIIESGQLSALKSFVNNTLKVIEDDLINGYFIKGLNENSPRYNSSLNLVTAASLLSSVSSPKGSRASTPAPETGTGMSFFKGASSALGNVVGAGAAAVSSELNSPKLIAFVIHLNTVAIGQEYFTRIVNNFSKNDTNTIQTSFPFGEESTIATNILSLDLLEPFVAVTNKIISEALISIYNQCIKSRLLTVVGDFLSDADDSNYLVYSTSMLNDTTLILGFTGAWRALIRPYQQVLHHTLVFSKLLRLIIVNLANILEKRLLFCLRKFKINELGALKLEKDVSSFISEVCEDNYELREKFIRVTQLILLVGMDDEEYEESNNVAYGYENADDEDYLRMNWVLTPSERKQFRKFRV